MITGSPTDVPRRRDAPYDESFSLAARLRFATGTLLDLPAAGDVRGARLAPFAQPIL